MESGGLMRLRGIPGSEKYILKDCLNNASRSEAIMFNAPVTEIGTRMGVSIESHCKEDHKELHLSDLGHMLSRRFELADTTGAEPSFQ